MLMFMCVLVIEGERGGGAVGARRELGRFSAARRGGKGGFPRRAAEVGRFSAVRRGGKGGFFRGAPRREGRFSPRRRGREVFHQMCSMLKGTSSIAEQCESSMNTASELIHELSSCTDGKRLAMDASAINCDTDLVDSTNSLTANSGSPYLSAVGKLLYLHDMPRKPTYLRSACKSPYLRGMPRKTSLPLRRG